MITIDKPYAILFNGPPGSGKDVASQYLIEQISRFGINTNHIEFKERLLVITAAIHGMDIEAFKKIYFDRNTKEMRMPRLNDHSPRSAVIHTAEDVIKPSLGKDFFAKDSVNKLVDGVNIFSDAGFKEESDTINVAVKRRMLIIQLTREGHSFDNCDSRRYVNSDCWVIKIHNDGTDAFFGKVGSAITTWMKNEIPYLGEGFKV